MKQFIPLIVPLSIILLLPACFKQPIRVSGEAFADTTNLSNGFAKGSSFTLNGSRYTKEGKEFNDELQTKELEKKIAIALEAKGFATKDSQQDADYLINFIYSSASENKVLNVEKYIPGQSITAYSNGYYGKQSQTAYTSGTIVYMPEEHTFFIKLLNFQVYDLKNRNHKNGKRPHVWKGSTWNVDESSDLRSYLDFLVIQLVEMLGKNTIKTVTVDLYDKDPAIKSLRQTYLNPIASLDVKV